MFSRCVGLKQGHPKAFIPLYSRLFENLYRSPRRCLCRARYGEGSPKHIAGVTLRVSTTLFFTPYLDQALYFRRLGTMHAVLSAPR